MAPPSHRMIGSVFVCSIAALFLLGPERATAQCEPTWLDQFPVTDIVGTIYAMTMFDEDGPGPMPEALYVAGDIRFAGTIPIAAVAKWDGYNWSAVGSGIIGQIGIARSIANAMIVWDDDGDGPNLPSLVIGGYFYRNVNNRTVLKLRNGTWEELRAGYDTNTSVYALEVYDDDGNGPHTPSLIVAGSLNQVYQPGSPSFTNCNRIARWDGTRWWTMGTGLQGSSPVNVNSMRVFDPDDSGPMLPELIVGGKFQTAGGVSATNVARWNGTTWSNVGGGVSSGPDDVVNTVEIVDFDGLGPQSPRLVVGGRFSSAGLVASTGLASWNGAEWTDLGIPQTREVHGIVSFGPDGETGSPSIYVAGYVLEGGSSFLPRLMKWDGASWVSVSPIPGNLFINSLLVADLDGVNGPLASSLFVGGSFSSATGDLGASLRGIARFDGHSWYKLGRASGGFGADGVDTLSVLEVADSGAVRKSLYAAGRFRTVASQWSRGIGKWDGRSWRRVGGGFDRDARAIDAFDEDGPGPGLPNLFVGGYFTQAGEIATNYLAKWDGTHWHAMSEQPNNYVFSLQRFDPDGPGPGRESLFVGGFFTSVGAMPANYIAQWDGTSWLQLGTGLDQTVWSMCVYDEDDDGPAPPRLFVGGYFTTAGGAEVNGVARWDGSNWSAVGGGISPGGLVYEMTVFDEDEDGPIKPVLVVCGQFISAGGQNAAGIAAWDGSTWTPLATTTGSFARKSAAVGFDPDGPGPAPPELIVTDQFSSIQGIPANSVARRLNGQWSTLGVSPSDGINSLGIGIASYDDDDDGPNPPSLFVGGFQTMAGGLPSERISRWSAPVPFVRAYPDAIGVKVNERVELSLDVGGLTPISFQWYRDGAPLSDSERVSGTNSATLVIEPAYRGDSGQYELYASNQCGYGWSPAVDVGIGCQSARPEGDMNEDGIVDGHDIAAFVNILLFDSEPDETVCVADLNFDNILDADDIEPFVSLLVSQ